MITKVYLENLGTVNKNKVTIQTDKGNFRLFFSYQTLVGIQYNYKDDEKQVTEHAVIQNMWSTTTGKLLNELEPNKSYRLTQEKFDSRVSSMFKDINK